MGGAIGLLLLLLLLPPPPPPPHYCGCMWCRTAAAGPLAASKGAAADPRASAMRERK